MPFTDSLSMKMSSLDPFQKKHKVSIVGSGNWGSTIAKVVAENTASHPDLFERDVQMWVFEEEVTLSKDSKHYDDSSELSTKPQKLTHLINQLHENVKYLPGVPLPHNVVANPSITDSVKGSTLLIFNFPHQFTANICGQIKGHILPYARGISCIKGVNVHESSISLFSETIGHELDIYCGALSGANIANEVAKEKFSETTVAYDPPPVDSLNPTPATSAGPSPSSSHVDLTKLGHKDSSGKTSKVKLKPLPLDYHPIDHDLLKTLFHRRYFHVRVVHDVAGVSLGGALKNIIALAAGFVDGLGWGDNAKAAVMRVGLLEMVDFGKRFFKTVRTGTFTEESAGVADLITTCAGGRNHRCAKLSVQRGVSIEEVEAKELNGQKLQGTLTTREVNTFLKSQGLEKEYPLFTAVYNILEGREKLEDLPDLIEPSSEERPETTAVPCDAHDRPPHPQPPFATNTPTRNSNLPLTSSAKPTSTLPAPLRSSIFEPPHPLSTSRYHRQILLPSLSISGQTLLSQTKILIVGLGGLGCPAALYLAGLGIQTLGLVDDDTVELSNLHRQILHREATVGTTKVESAIQGLKALNNEVEYIGYRTRLTAENALDIVESREYDLVLDCTDNPATRYLVSDICVLTGKSLISGAAQRTDGQLMMLNCPSGEGGGPCYRCIFPTPPAPEMVQTCADTGVLGPVVGVIGTLMATEAVKAILASDEEKKRWRRPTLFLYSAFSKDPRTVWRSVGLRGRRKGCMACGDGETSRGMEKITREMLKKGKIDYEDFCGMVQDVNLLDDEERIGATEFLERLEDMEEGESRRKHMVVDVREDTEFALGAKIRGSINLPISRILRKNTSVGNECQEDDIDTLLPDQPSPKEGHMIYFVCQRGNDSQIAAKRFLESKRAGKGAQWVGDVRGGFQALEKEANNSQQLR